MKGSYSCIDEIITIFILDSFNWSKCCYVIVILPNETVIFSNGIIKRFLKFLSVMVTSSEQLPSSLRLKNQSCLHHIVSKQLQTFTKGNIKATGINGVFRIMRPKSDKPVLGYPIFFQTWYVSRKGRILAGHSYWWFKTIRTNLCFIPFLL